MKHLLLLLALLLPGLAVAQTSYYSGPVQNIAIDGGSILIKVPSSAHPFEINNGDLVVDNQAIGFNILSNGSTINYLTTNYGARIFTSSGGVLDFGAYASQSSGTALNYNSMTELALHPDGSFQIGPSMSVSGGGTNYLSGDTSGVIRASGTFDGVFGDIFYNGSNYQRADTGYGSQIVMGPSVDGIGIGSYSSASSGGTFAVNGAFQAWLYPDGHGRFGTGYNFGGGSGTNFLSWDTSGNIYAGGAFVSVTTTGSSSYTAKPGLNTFTGSTASQTITLPSPAQGGEHLVIKNQSSVSVTIASASGSQIIPPGQTGAVASQPLAYGSQISLWSDGTYWNTIGTWMVARADLTGQSNTSTTADISFTPSQTGSFEVGSYVNVTTYNGYKVGTQASWSDENGNSVVTNYVAEGGSATGQYVTGYSFPPPIYIRAGTAGAITVNAVFSGSGTASIYDRGSYILEK